VLQPTGTPSPILQAAFASAAVSPSTREKLAAAMSPPPNPRELAGVGLRPSASGTQSTLVIVWLSFDCREVHLVNLPGLATNRPLLL
jgi:hypothetical protein